MRTPVDATTKDNWEEVIAHRDDVFLEGIDIFKDYLVVEERKNGLNQIRIKTWDGAGDEYLEFNDPAYTAGTRSNPDFDTEILRFGYSSMTTPSSTYDHNMRTGSASCSSSRRSSMTTSLPTTTLPSASWSRSATV